MDCEHGWINHVSTHEAAHAVIAYARGIPFLHVSIIHPSELQNVLPGQRVRAGGVFLPPDTRGGEWVSQRGDAAVDMLMAGRTAEMLAFGHVDPVSFSADMGILSKAMGWGLEHQAEALDIVNRSTTRLKHELPQRMEEISRVANGLLRELPKYEGGYLVPENARLSLSADEVAALIENT